MHKCKMVILQLKSQPIIIQAIFAGALDEVEELVNQPESTNCTDCLKRTPLHAAAFTGESQIADKLLEHGACVNAKDAKWVTPLHRACAVNSDDTVDVLLKYQADVSARDKLWQTPLHIAAAHDAYNCVDKLLNIIPNPNVTDRSGRTALHHAAYNGNSYVCELLINGGCIVNACDKRDCRPLHCAVQMGHLDTVEQLLQYGADVNAKDRNQYTPLHVAAASGMDSITKLLLNSGAEANIQNAYGNTPLHVACLNGHLACCQELALAGADLEAVNFRGQTPLHVAAASTHGVDCLAFLLAKNVDINRRSDDGRTALHMTAIHGRFTRSKTLIDKGALIDCADKNGSTPLHIAAQYGHDILANTLLSYGAVPTRKGYEGRTPLHVCCLSGYVECCRKFLQTGVNLNVRDDSGRSPLHCAAYKGSIECLDLLTSNGADFKLKDNFERLPLHYAVAQGHFQCVFTLVGIGSPINEGDIEGCTPLHLAAAYDQEAKCLEYLLSHRANPKSKDARGYSPLHYAIACGNLKGVDLLLNLTEEAVFKREGGNPDITPLHLAAKLGNVSIFWSVVTKYTDVNIQTDQGITPLILAAREGHSQCVQFLLRFGAKVSLCDNINMMTAVHYSAKNGHSQSLTLMLYKSEDEDVINMVDRHQRTALMLAVSGGHAECAQVLLRCKADPNIVDADEHSSLFRAVVNGQHNVVQLLLSKNSEVNNRDINGKTVFHLAAACGHLTCLQLIMEHAAEETILSEDKQNCTALHWACYHGHAHCVEYLLSKVSVKKLEGNSFSPVHCACFSGSESSLEHLVQHFGNDIVHLRDEKQRTSLHVAALLGHDECAKLLLKHGAEPQVMDEEGRTPFVAAAQYGQSSIVELLITCNIDLSSCDNDGNTALHWACLKKHHQTALFILENCHDVKLVDIQNKENKTPLHLAARNGLVDVTRELLRKGANVLAVDNEGLTPALCCAPSYSVAQCLALILQTLPDFLNKTTTEGSTLAFDLTKILIYPCLLQKTKKSVCTIQTQTPAILVNDPDLFDLKNAFMLQKRSPPPRKMIEIDNSLHCFIEETHKCGNRSASPVCGREKGKNLHKSEKALHLCANSLVMKPKKNYTLNCVECQRFQKMCFSCRKLMKYRKRKSLEKSPAYIHYHQKCPDLRKHNKIKPSPESIHGILVKVFSNATNKLTNNSVEETSDLLEQLEKEMWLEFNMNTENYLYEYYNHKSLSESFERVMSCQLNRTRSLLKLNDTDYYWSHSDNSQDMTLKIPALDTKSNDTIVLFESAKYNKQTSACQKYHLQDGHNSEICQNENYVIVLLLRVGSTLAFDLTKILIYPCLLQKTKKSVCTIQTQTPAILVNDPDLFDLKNAFMLQKISPPPRKIIEIDNSLDCFIEETHKCGNRSASPVCEREKGKNLHKSEKALHLCVNSSVTKPKNYYTLSCVECQRFQKMCFNCRKLMEYRKRKSLEKSPAYIHYHQKCPDLRKHNKRKPSPESIHGILVKVFSNVTNKLTNNSVEKTSDLLEQLQKEMWQEFNMNTEKYLYGYYNHKSLSESFERVMSCQLNRTRSLLKLNDTDYWSRSDNSQDMTLKIPALDTKSNDTIVLFESAKYNKQTPAYQKYHLQDGHNSEICQNANYMVESTKDVPVIEQNNVSGVTADEMDITNKLDLLAVKELALQNEINIPVVKMDVTDFSSADASYEINKTIGNDVEAHFDEKYSLSARKKSKRPDLSCTLS